MRSQKILSYKFNLSLGFIPVIITFVLCEIIAQDGAIYIGAGAGIVLSMLALRKKDYKIPQIILYSSTAMLLLLAIATLLIPNYCPRSMFPLTLEICVVIPPLIIYFNRKRFLRHQTEQAQKCCKPIFMQGAEATVVSARVILLIALLHFLIILCAMLVSRPLGNTTRHLLFNVAPLLVFLLGILFNQFGILYFNSLMRNEVFFPIVNMRGDVIGKALASDAVSRKNNYINPVVRIAVMSNGMLFLLPRHQCCAFERGKTDLLLEGYLIYKETLEEGAKRILKETLPSAPAEELRFNFVYHFENETTNRLVYLFTLDLKDDSILCNDNFKSGKLWTLRQMEDNMGRNFFGSCLEHEYENLKDIIYTREKYKES